MKKLLLVAFVIASMVVPAGLYAQVETPTGTIELGGKIKWNYIYMAEENDPGDTDYVAPIESMSTTNVELDINGTVGENVSYVIELQSMVGMAAATSSPGEMTTIGVRQAKIIISDLVPMTEVTLGTFNLPVGTYQNRATNDYDLILLPIGTVGLATNAVGAYAPLGLGWQNTGVNFAVKPMDMVQINLAIFNGNNAAPNVDADLSNSYLIGLQVMPVEGAMISITAISVLGKRKW